MWTSLVFNAVGGALFLAGSLVTTISLPIGIDLAFSGAAHMAIGSIVGSASYTARHHAYKSAGYDVDGQMGAAWTLTVLTQVSFASAMGTGITAAVIADSPDDMFLYQMVSVGMAGLTAILEGVNWMYVRGVLWKQDFERAAGYEQGKFTLYPVVTSNPDSMFSNLFFGIGGQF